MSLQNNEMMVFYYLQTTKINFKIESFRRYKLKINLIKAIEIVMIIYIPEQVEIVVKCMKCGDSGRSRKKTEF